MQTPIRVLFSQRMLCILGLGISSGLPLLLMGSTLKAWLKEDGVDLTIIGVYSLTGLPYTLKFVWAPLLDRFTLPFLGRRRGWIVFWQALLVLGLCAMAAVRPKDAPLALACLALFISFCSASQDIAIDAYRRDVLPDEELGLGSSMAVNGYRIGMLLAGAFALALADHIPWPSVYLTMAAVMAIGIALTFLCPEGTDQVAPPKNLREAVVLPFLDFIKRPYAFELLAFILLFKIGDSMASDMFNPFYLDIGYTKTEIGAIVKLFGFWATIGGGLLGGLAMVKLGIGKSLWIFGALQTLSTFGFCILAGMQPNLAALTTVVVFECLCTAMATSAYVGFMGSLCNRRFTATQYALLSSLMGVPRVIFGASSGWFAKHFGWSGYFLFCTALHAPGMLLLLRQKTWESAQLESDRQHLA